jgi:hypothetical protein
MNPAPGANGGTIALMQPNYLPWLGYFDLVALADAFILYDDVQFDKRSWRNRNRIYRIPEPLWLTAPVITAGLYEQEIRNVRLLDIPWQAKHLRSLRQTYGKAPHFGWCFEAMNKYLGGKTYEWLLDACVDGHHLLCSLLGLSTPVRLSSELGFKGIGKTERLVALCGALGARKYLSAAASRAYMVDRCWTDAGIELAYQDYAHPEYRQFGSTFVSHLSIVDALMFVGPAARAFVGQTQAGR